MSDPEFRTMEGEILDIKSHEKGGHIITIRYPNGSGKGFQDLNYLRIDQFRWYGWPSMKNYPMASLYQEKIYERHKLLQKYKPAEKDIPVVKTDKRAPSRCVYCHEEMAGMVAACLTCGTTMHIVCCIESGSECVTPGCKEKS